MRIYHRPRNVARYLDHDIYHNSGCPVVVLADLFTVVVSSNSRTCCPVLIDIPLSSRYNTRSMHKTCTFALSRAGFHPPRAVGVGVHRTRLRSLSPVCPFPQPDIRPIASALLAAAVPIVVLSNNLFPAGVRLPGASALRGVQLGGPIEPGFEELPRVGVRPIIGVGPPRRTAFARRLFEACADNL
jgi:hypothetical protein